MKENAVAKAIIIVGVLIALSMVIGSIILSRAPSFEKTGTLEVINKRTGAIYTLKGEKQKGQPFYQVVPGPLDSNSHIEPKFEK